MPGYIRKRGDHSWELRFDLPRGADGTRRQKSVAVKGTRRDAERMLTELLASAQNGSWIDPSKLTTGAYLRRWLQGRRGKIEDSTFERYEVTVEKHLLPALETVPLKQLAPFHIQNYIDGEAAKGLAARTVAQDYRVLHKALNDAVDLELLPKNPARNCSLPKPARYEGAVLSAADTMKLLMVAQGDSWHISVLLAATTGMRIGEILALHWESVDLDAGTLVVRHNLGRTSAGLKIKEPKTRSSVRVIALLPLTVGALRAYREKLTAAGAINELVVCHADGRMYHPTSLRRAFRSMLERAGLDRRRFHDLRHTHATLLLEQGVHPKVVQERLGHASMAITTDLYSHVMPTLQADAAAKLEAVLVTNGC